MQIKPRYSIHSLPQSGKHLNLETGFEVVADDCIRDLLRNFSPAVSRIKHTALYHQEHSQ